MLPPACILPALHRVGFSMSRAHRSIEGQPESRLSMQRGACVWKIQCALEEKSLLTSHYSSRFDHADVGACAGCVNHRRGQARVFSHGVIKQELINLAITQRGVDVQLAVRTSRRHGKVPVWIQFRNRETRPARWTHDLVLDRIRVAGEQRASIAHADHLPEIVAVNQVSVLIYGLSFEEERSGRE